MPTKIIRNPEHVDDLKTCAFCGSKFHRDKRYSNQYFARQKYCGQKCSAESFRAQNSAIYGNAEDRFWARVEKRGLDDCWLWTGDTNGRGYGLFSVSGRKVYAHRFSLSLSVGGSIGSGLACHKCDNPRCVNPKHLYAGDHKSNGADAANRNRFPGQKLTSHDALEIRSDSRPNVAIAKAYGITPAMVCAIKKRRKWKHLGDGNAD